MVMSTPRWSSGSGVHPKLARSVGVRRRPLRPGRLSARPRAADFVRSLRACTSRSPATSLGPLLVDREAVRVDVVWAPDEQALRGRGRLVLGRRPAAGAGRRPSTRTPPCARPGLRTVVVTGPRIDREAVAALLGVEVHGYVPGLRPDPFAACDVAVVQGGLTTTMELTAAGRLFWHLTAASSSSQQQQQQRHVAHRLDRHRACVRMDYTTSTPESIGEALADALARPVEDRPVPADGARRAAALIADLV